MTGTDDMGAPETIGQMLARLRAARGLDVRKVADDLRCDRAIIDALESDRYADLGAAVFARGHLRRYADHLGAPTDALLARWSAEQAASQPLPDLTRAPQAPRPIDTRRWGRLLAVVAGALAIGLAAWWILQGAGARPAPTVAATDPAATAQPVPVPAALPSAAASDMATGDVAATPGAAPAAAPVVSAASTGTAVTTAAPVMTPPIVAATPPAAAPPAAAVSDAVAAPGEIAMAFTTAADCWAEVFDAQGGRRLYQLIRAGQRVTATGKPPLRVTLGRGDVTRLELDGRTTAIPAEAIRDSVARFEIAASGAMRALPPVPKPAAPSSTGPTASAPAAPAAPPAAEPR